jgi:hypothetical protein
MSSPAPGMLDNLTLNVTQEIHVRASLEATFAALLEQLGPYNEVGEGKPMPMVIEAFPGGRWFRDLGNNTGHLWGHVQVIKPPTLLELVGPMFMSYPAIAWLQYRVTEKAGLCTLALTHRVLGEMDPQHREGVQMGWGKILETIKARATK